MEPFWFDLILMLILQIPELDFEIPPEAQCGSLSTVCFGYLLHAGIGSKLYFSCPKSSLYDEFWGMGRMVFCFL